MYVSQFPCLFTCELVDLLKKLLDVILHLFDLSGVCALTLPKPPQTD